MSEIYKYSIGAEIGRGAYGIANKCIDKESKETFVLKRVSALILHHHANIIMLISYR